MLARLRSSRDISIYYFFKGLIIFSYKSNKVFIYSIKHGIITKWQALQIHSKDYLWV